MRIFDRRGSGGRTNAIRPCAMCDGAGCNGPSNTCEFIYHLEAENLAEETLLGSRERPQHRSWLTTFQVFGLGLDIDQQENIFKLRQMASGRGVEITIEDMLRNAHKTDPMDLPGSVCHGTIATPALGDCGWITFRVRDTSDQIHIALILQEFGAELGWVESESEPLFFLPTHLGIVSEWVADRLIKLVECGELDEGRVVRMV